MGRRLRDEGLDFVDRAPVRLVFAHGLPAPADAVFHALAREPDAWPEWFSAVASCTYRGAGPYGTGTERLVRLRGGTRFVETVLAWDEPSRFVYRVDSTNAPGVRAMMEEWRLSPDAGGGTRVQWAFAVDGPAPLRTVLRLARPGLDRSFRGAVSALGGRLAADRERPAGG